MPSLSDIWGATDDKPEKKPTELTEKAWVRYYIDQVIDMGLNDKFLGIGEEKICQILGCGFFALIDIQSCNYMAFDYEQAQGYARATVNFERKKV